MRKMIRKEFIARTFGAFLIAPTVVFAVGCSSSDDAPVNPDPETALSECLENGALGNIAENHGHTLTIPKEDIDEAVEKTYELQGSSDHTHTITVTTQDYTALKNGSTMAVDIYTSTDNDHRHSVILLCAP